MTIPRTANPATEIVFTGSNGTTWSLSVPTQQLANFPPLVGPQGLRHWHTNWVGSLKISICIIEPPP
jgi:hypothetical protein